MTTSDVLLLGWIGTVVIAVPALNIVIRWCNRKGKRLHLRTVLLLVKVDIERSRAEVFAMISDPQSLRLLGADVVQVRPWPGLLRAGVQVQILDRQDGSATTATVRKQAGRGRLDVRLDPTFRWQGREHRVRLLYRVRSSGEAGTQLEVRLVLRAPRLASGWSAVDEARKTFGCYPATLQWALARRELPAPEAHPLGEKASTADASGTRQVRATYQQTVPFPPDRTWTFFNTPETSYLAQPTLARIQVIPAARGRVGEVQLREHENGSVSRVTVRICQPIDYISIDVDNVSSVSWHFEEADHGTTVTGTYVGPVHPALPHLTGAALFSPAVATHIEGLAAWVADGCPPLADWAAARAGRPAITTDGRAPEPGASALLP